MAASDPDPAGDDRLEQLRAQIDQLRDLVAFEPARYAPNLAVMLCVYGIRLFEFGREGEARRSIAEAGAIVQCLEPAERANDSEEFDTQRWALHVYRRAVAAIPRHSPGRPEWLDHLGTELLHFYERTGEERALNDALDACREAVAGTPENHPAKASVLANLGTTQLAQYRRTGLQGALEAAMHSYNTALSRSEHPRQVHYQYWYRWRLGDAERMWYTLRGHPDDLNHAIELLRQAAATVPADDPERAEILFSAGSALLTRFGHTEDTADLNAAVGYLRGAAEATPDDHADHEIRWLRYTETIAQAEPEIVRPRLPEGTTESMRRPG